MKIYDAIEKIDGITNSDKTFFLESLAGDASQLIPLLDDGGSKLQQLIDKAHNLDAIFTDLDVEKLHIANQSIADLSPLITGAANQFTVAMAPAINSVSSYVNELALAHGGWGDVAADVAEWVIDGLGAVLDVSYNIKTILLTLKYYGISWAETMVSGADNIGKSFVNLVNMGMIPVKESIQAILEKMGGFYDLLSHVPGMEYLKGTSAGLKQLAGNIDISEAKFTSLDGILKDLHESSGNALREVNKLVKEGKRFSVFNSIIISFRTNIQGLNQCSVTITNILT